MDGASPGNMPLSLGNVWCGEVRPALGTFGEPTLPNYAACGCYVGAWWGINPPPRCPAHEGTTAVPLTPFVAPQPQQFQFTPSLSDADVERIARRVAELLREDRP